MRAFLAVLCLVALAACGGGGGGDLARDTVATKRAPVRDGGACGIRDAWVVRQVAGVRLSQPATISGETLRRLERWVIREAIPTVGRQGGGLAELRVASSYACRTRNSRPGAKISMHAKGGAIDISGFAFRDGSRAMVLTGWGMGDDGRLLRRLHRSACGTFGTVLGPESDRFHQDHFHFDIDRHRGGPYCR